VERLNTSRVQGARAKAGHLTGFDALYLNSASSARSLRLLPELPPVVVAHLHELDSAFDKWIDPVDRELLLEKADLFVVAAHCIGEHLVNAYGVDPSHILRPPHEFIGPPSADPAGTKRARARLGLHGDETVIGAIGQIGWRKGTDLFIQVADHVHRQLPSVPLRFVWLGSGQELAMKPYHHDVAAYGLEDVVSFVGEVGDVPAWIGLFDMFCLTSREDPFPLVCLEAGALGVPVISFANGGMAELAVADGPDDPLLTIVDYADVEAMAAAVVDRITDPDLRRRDGERLQRHLLDHALAGNGATEVSVALSAVLTAAERSAS
jgi:glycosyltransferase involved in cell wall biosynthesis